MNAITQYDAARRALAEAKTLVEVKNIADKMAAMKEYARRAGDYQMMHDAAELRDVAERRLGEMQREQPKAKGGQPYQATGSKLEPVTPTLKDLGIDKKLSSRAQKLAAIPEPEFQRRLKERRKQDSKRVASLLRDADKGARRAEREVALAAKITAFTDRRYGVLYADPPWRFEPWSRDSGLDRSADNHYPTLTFEAIAALAVPAAPDAALFLWTTVPCAELGFKLMSAWQFEYRSQFIWSKDRLGTGYWNRNRHEILLLGIRGKVPAPAPGDQPPSVIEAPVGRHSEKPAIFAEIIETMFPTLPRLEMFARGVPRRGWDTWGADIDDEGAA